MKREGKEVEESKCESQKGYIFFGRDVTIGVWIQLGQLQQENLGKRTVFLQFLQASLRVWAGLVVVFEGRWCTSATATGWQTQIYITRQWKNIVFPSYLSWHGKHGICSTLLEICKGKFPLWRYLSHSYMTFCEHRESKLLDKQCKNLVPRGCVAGGRKRWKYLVHQSKQWGSTHCRLCRQLAAHKCIWSALLRSLGLATSSRLWKNGASPEITTCLWHPQKPSHPVVSPTGAGTQQW